MAEGTGEVDMGKFVVLLCKSIDLYMINMWHVLRGYVMSVLFVQKCIVAASFTQPVDLFHSCFVFCSFKTLESSSI